VQGHGDGRGVLAEAVVSWISLLGVLTAMRVYWKQTARSRLERCVLFLLGCLATLLFVRGYYWMTGLRSFGVLTFSVAALVPFAIFLYVEALLRRHLPLAAKALVLAGTAGFLGVALAGRLHADPFWLRMFAAYVLLLMVVMLGVLLLRDRADLTAIENRAANAIAAAVVLLVPFLMTDFATDLGLEMVRVGSIGILMFAYATVIAAEPRGTTRTVLTYHLSVIGIATAMGALEAYMIGDLRLATIARAGSFFACVVLVFMIYLRVHTHTQITRGPGLVRSIASADTRSTESFLQVLERLPVVAGYRLVRASDLGAYEHWTFASLFPADGSHVVTRRELRKGPGAPPEEQRYRADQLADLLEREGMTHAVLVRDQPLVLLLVHIPSGGLEQSAIAQLGLVRTVAEAIERHRAHA
jgi:hypothetical protein